MNHRHPSRLTPHAFRLGAFRLGALILLFALCALLLLPEAAEAGEWGRLAFQIVGTVIGSYFGGPMGGMIGGAIGGMIGGLIFGGEKGPVIRGPRLQDKSVQSAAYGAHITKHWGTDRIPAQLIFSSGLKEKKHKTEVGGKGMPGGGTTSITYTYSVDMMLSFGHKAKGIKRLWADTKLILDHTGQVSIKKKWLKEGRKFVVRDGNEAQRPSALEESYHGAGNCSAHRGLFCLEVEDFQLANFANRIPNFTAEVYTEGAETFAKIASYVAPAAPYSWWTHSFGYIDPNGEIWALYYPFSTRWPYPGYAHAYHWTLDRTSDPEDEFHPFWQDSIVQTASVHGQIRVRSDEPSAAAFGTNNNGVSFSYFQLEAGTRVDVMGADVSPLAIPEIMVKEGEAMWVWYTAGPPGMVKCNLAGAVLATDGGAINAAIATDEIADLGKSESYLWILVGGKLYKIHPDALTVISSVTISGTTGQQLAIAVVSDSEIRLATAAADGTRFYVVNPATGAATLDQYAPNESYASIRGFPRFGLRYEGGMYIVDFGGYVGGFGALIDFFASQLPTLDIPLWKIVRDINIMSGLDSVVDSVPPATGDIKVDELTDLVHGYSLTRPMSAREALAQLQLCYFFDCRDKDLQLDYPKRGKAPVRSLPGADLAARSSLTEGLPDRLTLVRTRESELPIRVHVIYNNYEFAYQPGHEYAPRLITDARATMTAEIAVAINSTYARKVAETLLALAHLERDSFSARVSRKHIRIDAADNIEVIITEEA